MAPATSTHNRRRTVVRGVLAVLFGAAAFLFGVFEVWAATLVFSIAAVLVAPPSWIHVYGDDRWSGA